jgi:hypothetical protein
MEHPTSYRAEKDAARVDRHQADPGLGVELVLDRAAGEPRVVDEDVTLLELGEGVGGGRRECVPRWSRSRSMPSLVRLPNDRAVCR